LGAERIELLEHRGDVEAGIFVLGNQEGHLREIDLGVGAIGEVCKQRELVAAHLLKIPIMPAKDPNHWLYRLTSEEWLRAAFNELLRAEQALLQKQQRPGVAGARRAAGMAWNAVLVQKEDASYGRSYMEHLQALAHDPRQPEPVRQAAEALVTAPLSTNVIPIGRGDTRMADNARCILEHARVSVAG
jgi:hypothetical protein